MSNIVVLKKHIADPKAIAQFRMALPDHITPEKFQRVALTALMNAPDIAFCTTDSVMNSLMKCAQDGLLPDGREAALVKFGDKAQYLPMAPGLIKRMKNSGDISTISVHVVYENDEFEFILGDEEKIDHRPKLRGERGKPVLVYAIAKFKDGGVQREIMTVDEVEKVRAVSRAKDSPAWKNWWDEMAKKSVIHRLAKRVTTSSDVDTMIRRDVRLMLNGHDEEETPAAPSLLDTINGEIAKEEAIEHKEKPRNGSLKTSCLDCNGKGSKEWTDGEETGTEPCQSCDGTGKIEQSNLMAG